MKMLRRIDHRTLYLKCEKLSSGTDSEVWSVSENGTGYRLAAKLTYLKNLSTNKVKEEIILHSKCRHPNVVNYIDSFLDGNYLWVIHELLDGGPLSTLCTSDNVWPEDAIAYVCKQVLQGLERLHSLHIIHRDIRAENIHFSYNGKIKIANFTHAVTLDTQYPRRASVVGSPCWMAPEAADGEEYDTKADIWSLGITILELLDGEPPLFQYSPLKTLRMVLENPAPSLKKSSLWSPGFNHFMKSILTKNPEGRPDTKMLFLHPFIMMRKQIFQGEFGIFFRGLKVRKVIKPVSRLPETNVTPDVKQLELFDQLYSSDT